MSKGDYRWDETPIYRMDQGSAAFLVSRAKKKK